MTPVSFPIRLWPSFVPASHNSGPGSAASGIPLARPPRPPMRPRHHQLVGDARASYIGSLWQRAPGVRLSAALCADAPGEVDLGAGLGRACASVRLTGLNQVLPGALGAQSRQYRSDVSGHEEGRADVAHAGAGGGDTKHTRGESLARLADGMQHFRVSPMACSNIGGSTAVASCNRDVCWRRVVFGHGLICLGALTLHIMRKSRIW